MGEKRGDKKKTATTLDVLSSRAYFRIGGGWYEREARGFGPPSCARDSTGIIILDSEMMLEY